MLKKIKRWFKRPSNPAGHVYYAKLRTPQGFFYKVGYTSKSSLADRLAYGSTGDEKLIEQEFFFTYRKDAWDVEQTLLEHFGKQRAFGKFSKDPMKPLNGRGQSELFYDDILGLDDALYHPPDDDATKAAKRDLDNAGEGCLMALIGLILVPFTAFMWFIILVAGIIQVFERPLPSRIINPKRPVHPPAIKALVDELRDGSPKNTHTV